MIASNLAIRKETMEKNKLTRKELGKLRWEKLKELAESGVLATAKDRYAICEMIGGEQKNVYATVGYYIKKGFMREEIVSPTERSYYLTGTEPSYDTSALQNGHKRWQEGRPKQPKVAEVEKQIIVEPKATEITITAGDMTITIRRA